jgi:hypothetical protein
MSKQIPVKAKQIQRLETGGASAFAEGQADPKTRVRPSQILPLPQASKRFHEGLKVARIHFRVQKKDPSEKYRLTDLTLAFLHHPPESHNRAHPDLSADLTESGARIFSLKEAYEKLLSEQMIWQVSDSAVQDTYTICSGSSIEVTAVFVKAIAPICRRWESGSKDISESSFEAFSIDSSTEPASESFELISRSICANRDRESRMSFVALWHIL